MASFLLCLNPALPTAEALTLVLPPGTETEPVIWEPFADQLENHLQEPVALIQTSDWNEFILLVRSDRLDLVFGPPHVIAWLRHREGWVALARIEDDLHYIVAAPAARQDIFEAGDLVGRRVCTPLAPDLGNLLLFSRFTNRNRQPVSVPTPVGRDALLSLDDERCDALVMIESIYNSAPAGLTESFTLLMKSEALANYGFASGIESETRRALISAALLGKELRNSLGALLLQFSDHDLMIKPGEDDYSEELAEWISGTLDP